METSNAPPVDVDGFRDAMRQAGVEEVVDITLEVYAEEASRLFADLYTAVEGGDTETIRAAAHSLKSSSSNIWAHEAARHFATMEAVAAQQDDAGITATFAVLKPEFESVMACLRDMGVGS
jgi:HPt (histidine-containing phosphotransfer) domain-containing protein